MGVLLPIQALRDPGWLEREYVEKRRASNEIAQELGCSSATVLRSLKEANIPIRSKSRAGRLARSGYDFDEAKAAALYEAGASTTDIRRMFGASPQSVLAALRRQGVRIRSKREAALRRRDITKRRMPRASQLVGVVEMCAACGRQEGLELHHVNADIYDNRTQNLVALCWEHHMLVELLITRALQGIKQRELLRQAEGAAHPAG